MSWSISRVLSWTIIHLRRASPLACSDLPGSAEGHGIRIPIWSCSEWGLPSPRLLPAARCALTAPFHPYLRRAQAVSFLLHFPWAHTPQALPGTLISGARTFLCQISWQRPPNRLNRDCTLSSGPRTWLLFPFFKHQNMIEVSSSSAGDFSSER